MHRRSFDAGDGTRDRGFAVTGYSAAGRRERARMSRKIRTLLVDQDASARAAAALFLRAYPDVEIVGECGDGAEAVERIEQLHPELVIAEVMLPALDAFTIIERLKVRVPHFVFVTAHREHAARAFGIGAVDYLLKPLTRSAMDSALAKARERIAGPNVPRLFHQLLVQENSTPRRSKPQYLRRIFVKEGGRGVFLRTSELAWVRASGHYVMLYVNGIVHKYRSTIAELENQLDPHTFARVHRHTLINLEYVAEVTTELRGVYTIRMKDGTRHRLTRTFRDRVLGRLADGTS